VDIWTQGLVVDILRVQIMFFHINLKFKMSTKARIKLINWIAHMAKLPIKAALDELNEFPESLVTSFINATPVSKFSDKPQSSAQNSAQITESAPVSPPHSVISEFVAISESEAVVGGTSDENSSDTEKAKNEKSLGKPAQKKRRKISASETVKELLTRYAAIKKCNDHDDFFTKTYDEINNLQANDKMEMIAKLTIQI